MSLIEHTRGVDRLTTAPPQALGPTGGNTGSGRSPRGGTVQRCYPRRADRTKQCGSSPSSPEIDLVPPCVTRSDRKPVASIPPFYRFEPFQPIGNLGGAK